MISFDLRPLLATIVVLFFSLVAALFAIWILLMPSTVGTTAAEVFEAQALALALDEGRYDDAAEFSDPWCQQADPDTVRTAIRDLEQRYGLEGFVEVFPVVGVWSHSDGEQAILELGPPPGLPAIQPLRKMDGEWKLTCE